MSKAVTKIAVSKVSLENSTIEVSAFQIAAGESALVVLNVKNQEDSEISPSGVNVNFLAVGGTSTGVFSSVTHNGNGVYSANFTGLFVGTPTQITAEINGKRITSALPTIEVVLGNASKLSFIQGPTSTQSSITINPAISVEVRDNANNIISDYVGSINIAIDTLNNPGDGLLAGSVTMPVINGVAIFNDLSIDSMGSGYRLIATSAALDPAISNSFNINPTAVSFDLTFNSPIPADYVLSDVLDLELVGDLVRLRPTIQEDSQATETSSATFSSGSRSGISYGLLSDGVTSGLKLGSGSGCDGSTSNCANQLAGDLYELNSTWTPQWGTLTHYWKLNNTLTPSKGLLNLTPIGSASFSPLAKLGSHAGSLAGADDLFLNTSGPNITGWTQASVSIWFKRTSADTSQGLFLIYDPITIGDYLACEYRGGELACFQYSNNATEFGDLFIPDASLPAMGTWTHLVLTWSGPQLKAYINGKLIATDSLINGSLAAAAYRLNLGGYEATIAGGYGWEGQIDDFALWSTVLTDNDVEAIYERQSVQYSGVFTSRMMDAKSSLSWTNLSWLTTLPFMKELPDAACSPGPTCVHANNETVAEYTSLVSDTLMDDVVGLWHFNEANGTIGAASVIDDSGNGHHGTPTAVSFGNLGKLDKAVSLSASSIEIADSLNFNLADEATFALWVKANNFTSHGSVFEKCVVGDTCDFMLYVGMNELGFEGFRPHIKTPLGWLYGTINFVPSPDVWYHVAYSYNSAVGTMKGYINGVEYPIVHAGGPVTGQVIQQTAGSLKIGASARGGTPFSGMVDELAIWKRELSSDEIKQIYQRGSSRVKYQVRTCNDLACVGENWQGPDGTASTYFSEINNNTTALTGLGNVKTSTPSMIFSEFSSPPVNNQYFQYRAILESDSATIALMPELKSTKVDPVHYPLAPSIYGNNGVAFSEINNFAETLGLNGCSDNVTYNLSLDKITWKFWNGSAWDTSTTPSQSSTASSIHAQRASFSSQVGTGDVFVKAYLNSTGYSACELDNIHIGGNR